MLFRSHTPGGRNLLGSKVIYGQRLRFLLKKKFFVKKKKVLRKGRQKTRGRCVKKKKERSEEKGLTSGSRSLRKMGRAADESSLCLD